jgi:hypothetical protein
LSLRCSSSFYCLQPGLDQAADCPATHGHAQAEFPGIVKSANQGFGFAFSLSTRKHFSYSRSVSMTHRASLPACGRLLHLDSAVRQLRRRFFPLPPMCEVDALPLASTVEWAGGSSF